jgi:hypothetical protein
MTFANSRHRVVRDPDRHEQNPSCCCRIGHQRGSDPGRPREPVPGGFVLPTGRDQPVPTDPTGVSVGSAKTFILGFGSEIDRPNLVMSRRTLTAMQDHTWTGMSGNRGTDYAASSSWPRVAVFHRRIWNWATPPTKNDVPCPFGQPGRRLDATQLNLPCGAMAAKRPQRPRISGLAVPPCMIRSRNWD